MDSRRLGLIGAAALVVGVLGVFVGAPVLDALPAHTAVRTADPAPSAVVPAPVDTVTLTFFGRVNGATISLTDPDGNAVEPISPSERSADGLVVVQRFAAVDAAGTYQVDYLIDNEDGFAQPGAYVFEVVAAPESSNWGLVVVGAGCVVAAVFIVGIRRRRSD